MLTDSIYFCTQQKLKEEREAKRAQLDGRHDYILSIVASCVGLEKAEVEDSILEGSQVNSIRSGHSWQHCFHAPVIS